MYPLRINIDMADWNDLQSGKTNLPAQEDEILTMLENIANNANISLMLTSEGKQIARLIYRNDEFKQLDLE